MEVGDVPVGDADVPGVRSDSRGLSVRDASGDRSLSYGTACTNDSRAGGRWRGAVLGDTLLLQERDGEGRGVRVRQGEVSAQVGSRGKGSRKSRRKKLKVEG